MEQFIRSKYESKRWAMEGPVPDPATLGDATAYESAPAVPAATSSQAVSKRRALHRSIVRQALARRGPSNAPKWLMHSPVHRSLLHPRDNSPSLALSTSLAAPSLTHLHLASAARRPQKPQRPLHTLLRRVLGRHRRRRPHHSSNHSHSSSAVRLPLRSTAAVCST